MSASSRNPPSEMRWKGRPSTCATERARLVLPTPGGPTKHRMGARPRPFRSCRTCTPVHTSARPVSQEGNDRILIWGGDIRRETE
eukprot:416547-Prorocentrum_minimum.AAC.1